MCASRLPRAALVAPLWQRFSARLRAFLGRRRLRVQRAPCAFCERFVPPDASPELRRIMHETHLAVSSAQEAIADLAAGRPPTTPIRPFLWTTPRRRRRGLFGRRPS